MAVYFCYFKDNWAKNHGGAIYTQYIYYDRWLNEKDESNLRDSYFENNVARGGDGGAIYINRGTSERPIENCYFLKNHAAEDVVRFILMEILFLKIVLLRVIGHLVLNLLDLLVVL